jgi:lipopolysaccharide biosynthesis protein
MLNCIAFYLPQYHPVPENDRWWSPGFTEWTNVARQRPLFKGHYQPHFPADLGFYDLRLPEVREKQADLAQKYHINGFCYYHYWFHGKRLLERPLEEVVRTGKPDFPFCVYWANHSWTRSWIGDDKGMLLEQTYSPEDDINHAKYLSSLFSDPRYIKVDGRPVFLIYRPADLPSAQRTLECFTKSWEGISGVAPYFIAVDANCVGRDFRNEGFDAVLAFTPQLGVSGSDAFNDARSFSKLQRNVRLGVFSGSLKIFDEKIERCKMEQIERPYPFIPSCFIGWDNSPRKDREGIIYVNSSPDFFEEFLRLAVLKAREHPHRHGLVFINAWNEWAESNHLEPDLKYGHGYLEACQKVLTELG